MSTEEPTPNHHSRRSTTTSIDNSSAAESISLPHSDTPSRSKLRHDNNFQTHEEIFNQHNDQIQQIFDNRHHDINFDDDGTASLDDESLGNSSLSSLDDASLSELRSALIARRQRILDEGSVTKKRHRRGRSLDGSWASLSFASLTGSLTSLTRRRKKKKKEKSSKKKEKDKSAKKKKKKKKEKRESAKDSGGEEKEKKSKKKKSTDGGNKKTSKRGDEDDGASLKCLDKKKSSKQKFDDGGTLGTSGTLDNSRRSLDKSGRSWDQDKSSGKNRSLFNLNMSMGNNNDSHAFVFYACDENTGCCAFHPEIQLRKKARLGGWVDVLKQCPKCNDPKGDDNSSLRRGDDNASWRRDDDNSSWRRRERGNPSLRRRDDDNSSLRRRDDDRRNLRPRGDERRNLESNRRQSTRNLTDRSSRHLGLDQDRAREKSQRMPQYDRGLPQRSNRDYPHDRRDGRSNRDRDASRRDLHHGHPRRDLQYGSSRRDLQHNPSRRNLDHSSRLNRNIDQSSRSNRSGEHERNHRVDPRKGYSDRHGRNEVSKRHLDRDQSKRVVREPSKRGVNESNKRRPRQKESSSSSSDSSSSSSSSSSDYVRPKSKRPTVKSGSNAKDGDKTTKKSRVAASSDRHNDLKKDKSSRKATQEIKTKTSRGRTLSPPKSPRQLPSMKDIHKHIRKQSNSRSRSRDRTTDVFIDPTYQYAKDLFENQFKQQQSPPQVDTSTTSETRERTKSPPRRASVDSNGKPKPVVFKPVNFNPPPSSKYSGTESDHSFNESIEFASYRKLSKESFDDIIYSTDPDIGHAFESDCADSNSNFSDTLDAVKSNEKASNEDAISSVFEEAIQSVNPKLFQTINNILEEEQRKGDKAASNAKSEENRKRVSKSLGHTSQLSTNPDQYNVSATSLNASEPSLMETSADVSPNVQHMAAKVTDHRRTQSFHPDLLYSRPDSFQREKAKSLYPNGTTEMQADIDLSERSYYSVEQSISSSASRRNLKEMTKQQMLAFASLESMARQKGKVNSKDEKSFNSKAGAPENAHKSAEISSSLIDQMVRRLSSVGSVDGSTDDRTKDTVLADLMKFYADKDDASGSNNSSTVVTNLHWKGIGMYTGQVNEKIEPHGQGQLVMHTGATLYGQWSNGRPVSNNDVVDHNKERDAECPAKTQEASVKAAVDETPAYKLGDEGRRRDMIKEKDREVVVAQILKLQKGDPAFIRRTDGAWTFARVKTIDSGKDTAYFFVNPSGSTKSYKSKYWHSHIRICRIPNEKLPAFELPKRRSSNESLMSDSDMSELVDLLHHSMLEEHPPEKSSAPPRTFEIKEIREYEPTKNRFSIKDLIKQAQIQHLTKSPAKGRESPTNENCESDSITSHSHRDRRPSSIDCSETDRSTTSKGLLRKGRFSFHEEDKPYVGMKRNVSFSKEQETRSYTKDDVADDISTKTEDDDDDNFDVNALLSSTRAGGASNNLNLRGIEP